MGSSWDQKDLLVKVPLRSGDRFDTPSASARGVEISDGYLKMKDDGCFYTKRQASMAGFTISINR